MSDWNRPDERFIDFGAERFVVGADAGLRLATEVLPRGAEVPSDALDARALRQEYKVHRIELLSYAASDPDLRQACIKQGARFDAPKPVLDGLSRNELSKLCDKYGLSTTGSKDELRQRLAASTVG